MKIEFHIRHTDGIPSYKVAKITYSSSEFIPYGDSGQYYPTKEAAIIHTMISIDADLKERRNENFVRETTRMTLRMIGSDSAY